MSQAVVFHFPTREVISKIAERCEAAIYGSQSRYADRLLIEGAINEVLMTIVHGMEIQINAPVVLDLKKV